MPKILSNSKIRSKLGSSLINVHVLFVTNDLSHAIFEAALCILNYLYNTIQYNMYMYMYNCMEISSNDVENYYMGLVFICVIGVFMYSGNLIPMWKLVDFTPNIQSAF